MDQEKIIAIVKEFAKLVKQNFSVEQIYLFGSHANGNALEESDIDVAVILKQIGQNYLAQNTKLFQLRRSVDLRIEPVLIESSNDVSGFLSEIKATGIQIY
ncbi:MAG: nucleotidyltransferase domain-containing protein [Candidatus Cloacimonadales bacterium]|nr:nucleotidyltransferase domain-containing protein [Candidatus Cloacimonadales bacterium]